MLLDLDLVVPNDVNDSEVILFVVIIDADIGVRVMVVVAVNVAVGELLGTVSE